MLRPRDDAMTCLQFSSLLLAPLLWRDAAAVDVDIEAKIDSLLKDMKSMPGPEGLRMFTTRELLEWEDIEMDDAYLQADPAKPRPRRKKTRQELSLIHI